MDMGDRHSTPSSSAQALTSGRCIFLPLLHLAVGLEAWRFDYRNFCVIPHFNHTVPLALSSCDVEFVNVVSPSLVLLASQGGTVSIIWKGRETKQNVERGRHFMQIDDFELEGSRVRLQLGTLISSKVHHYAFKGF